MSTTPSITSSSGKGDMSCMGISTSSNGIRSCLDRNSFRKGISPVALMRTGGAWREMWRHRSIVSS